MASVASMMALPVCVCVCVCVCVWHLVHVHGLQRWQVADGVSFTYVTQHKYEMKWQMDCQHQLPRNLQEVAFGFRDDEKKKLRPKTAGLW
jgi:hypothetical protein